MKKIGIITIIDCNNYGNRLQSYALQCILKKYSNMVYQIPNYSFLNEKKHYYMRLFKNILNLKGYSTNIRRKKSFKLFEKNIKYSNFTYTAKTKKIDLDYLIVGSDQVWNPKFGRLRKVDLLSIVEPSRRIAYAASFGISNLTKEEAQVATKDLKSFKKISVREDSGKKIVEELTGRKDVEVLVDPTMLLTAEEWDKVSKRPKQLDTIKKEKYILNYFLGDLSESRKRAIEKIAKDNNCHIINILDKKDPFYISGPSEFLYLEKHAFLICTDSFHSSVFAILYNRPFVVFDREQEGMNNMGSRMDTLLSKFKLKNRRFNGKEITEDNLKHDYIEAYKILEKERKKSEVFLKKALDIKDSD